MDALEKDQDRQLLRQIAANSKHLDSLEAEDISTLTELFHLEKTDNQSEIFHRLRDKLCQILIIERENYQDYLKLPKFKRIRPETIDQITLFWEFIWLTFIHDKQEKKAAKRIQLQNRSGLMQAPLQPNLGCFNYFSAFQTMNQPKMPFSPYPYFYNFPNYQFPQFYPQNPTLNFNPFPYVQKQPNFNIQQQKQPINNNQSSVVFKNEHLSDSQNRVNNQISNIINIHFLHCVCSGKDIDQTQQFYSCSQCFNCYHISCLKLKKVNSKPCPLCTLTKDNIFTEQQSRPIKIGWLQLNKQEYFVTKIHFNQDQMNVFKGFLPFLENTQEGRVRWIDFNILKISEGPSSKKINKTSFMINSSQIRKMQTRRWIQLKLKQITHQCLAFYVITLTKIKQYDIVINEYNAMDKQINLVQLWLEQQKKERKKVVIDLTHPKTKKLIELPVRGEFCDHLECEDLLYFYNNFKSSPSENSRLQCSYCKNSYNLNSKFISDQTLYSMLQSKQENKNHKIKLSEQSRPEWMLFDPSEDFESIEQEQNNGEQMQSEV